MRRAEIVQGQSGQVLRFQAPEGRPASAPTVGIKDSGGGVVAAPATTGVALDSVNTTVASAAAAGVSQIALTSVTGILVGQEYRLTNALQQQEDMIVTGVDSSGKIVYLDTELQHSYAALSAFVSCAFYRTLTAAEVASLGELFVATATYTVTGQQSTPLLAIFDVVICPLRNRNPLTVAALKRLWPDLTGQEWTEQAGQSYGPQRQQAWDQICDELYTISEPKTGYKRPAMVVSAENFAGWALAELAVILQDAGIPVLRIPGLDGAAVVARLDEKLAKRKSAALASITWYREDQASESLDEESGRVPLGTHFVA